MSITDEQVEAGARALAEKYDSVDIAVNLSGVARVVLIAAAEATQAVTLDLHDLATRAYRLGYEDAGKERDYDPGKALDLAQTETPTPTAEPEPSEAEVEAAAESFWSHDTVDDARRERARAALLAAREVRRG